MGRLYDFTNFDGVNLLNDVFVETGTFQGETLAQAVNAGFKEIHTIDVVQKYCDQAKIRFKDYENLHCHCGTSPDILSEILDGKKSTTFWLDAHYQNNADFETCEKYGQCPVLEELKVIFSIEWQARIVILIDDSHMFRNPDQNRFKVEEWPKEDKIFSIVPEGYTIKDINDILIITRKD